MHHLESPRAVYDTDMRVSPRSAFVVAVALSCAFIALNESRVFAAGADSSTLLLLHGDGVDGAVLFPDDSRFGRTITVVGNTSTQKEESKFGFSGILFDGTNDELEIADATELTWAGNFTIDFWFWRSSGQDAAQDAFFGTSNTPASGAGYDLNINTSRNPTFVAGTDTSVTCSNTVAATTWQHLAVVRSGATTTMYVNGQNCGFDSSSTVTINPVTTEIGANGGGGDDFNGYMDEIRFSDVARWTTTFTPPTRAYAGAIEFTGPVLITGNAHVTGTISKGAGTFAIDHPLDPKAMLLYHSFVESPDVKNVYDGIVTLDERGEAEIPLPSYFIALNKDFRYLATPFDGAMPDLHLKNPVNRSFFDGDISFEIAGGTPGGRVSWQVTGVRHDAFIREHPVEIEVPKSSETIVPQGECLHQAACI